MIKSDQQVRLRKLLLVVGAPLREDYDENWEPHWGIVRSDGFPLLRDDTYMLDHERQALIELVNLVADEMTQEPHQIDAP